MNVPHFSLDYCSEDNGDPGATVFYNGMTLDVDITDRVEIIALFDGIRDFKWIYPFAIGFITTYQPYTKQYLTTKENAAELGAGVIRTCEKLVNPDKEKAEYQNRDEIHYVQDRPDKELSDRNYELSKPEQYRLMDRYFCFTKNSLLTDAGITPEDSEEIVARIKVFRHCPGEILNLKQKTQIDPIKYEEQSSIEIEPANQFKAQDWISRFSLNHIAGWHYESGKLIPKDNIFFYVLSISGSKETVGKVMVCFAKMDEDTDLLEFLQDMSVKDLAAGILEENYSYKLIMLVEPGSDAWNEIIGADDEAIDENRILNWRYNTATESLRP